MNAISLLAIDAANLTDGRKIVCVAGQPPRDTALDIAAVAVKVEFTQATTNAAHPSGGVSLRPIPQCQAKTHNGSDMDFEFRQSRGEPTDPGTYSVTVRVCTNESLGTGHVCHEVAADLPGGPASTCTASRPARSSSDGASADLSRASVCRGANAQECTGSPVCRFP